jgi:uncharacterized membrane protein HdeD (DUF308 family)
MRLFVTTLRVLLGLTMLVVGVLKFAYPEFNSGWLWQLIGAAEVLGGAAVLSGKYAPLGLAILAPVVAGILAFSIATGGEELSAGVLLAAIHLWLAWRSRAAFEPFLRPVHSP